jgi:hypothetical protein
MQQIAFIGLTTDNPNSDITPSPYSIRYYTQQCAPIQTGTTIHIRLQVDGGANRSLTNKQEYNTSTGVFLGFTGTAKNVYYYDIGTKRIKTSTHGIFDEANITVPQAERSNASQALIDLGYRQDDDTTTASQECHSPPIAQIQLLSPASKLPTQGSVLAAGYDVYSTTHCIIQPQTVAKLPLGIAIAPPKGSYVQLH